MIIFSINDLTPSALEHYPVWEFINNDELGETAMRPVENLPIRRLENCLIGTRVSLANGDKLWAVLGNFNPDNPSLNEHFLTMSVEWGGHWFTLARYHDHDYDVHGPASLATFLGKKIDEIFPVSYDIRACVNNNSDVLKGVIREKPLFCLRRSDIIRFSVPRIKL